MSIERRSGSKVDMHSIKELALVSAQYIESWTKTDSNESLYDTGVVPFKRPKNSAHTPSVKAKYYARLATTIKNRLHDDKRKSKKSKIALSTYSSYLSDIRKHLQRELDLKSSNIVQDINDLKTKHKEYSRMFDKIAQAKAENIKTVRGDVLSELESIDSIEAEDAYNDLSVLNVHHILISKLAPTRAQSAKRKKSIADNRLTRKQHATTITYEQIELVMSECLESDDFYELATGIALATGRRAIECVHTGTFKASRRKLDISFAGVAKKSATHARGAKYIIPLLIESKKIISAVEKLRNSDRYKSLRSDIANMPLDEQNIIINRRVAGGLNNAIRRLFDTDNLVFKDSRTIAGHIAVEKIYKTQERYKKLDIGAFRTQYFIHDTFEEAVNYEHIKIDFNASFDATKKEQLKGVAKLNKANTSALEAITSELRALPAKGMRPVLNLHEKVISALKDSGAFALSSSVIYKGKRSGDSIIKIGGSKPVIKRYLENSIVKKAVAKYHKANNLKTRKK